MPPHFQEPFPNETCPFMIASRGVGEEECGEWERCGRGYECVCVRESKREGQRERVRKGDTCVCVCVCVCFSIVTLTTVLICACFKLLQCVYVL